MDGAAGDYCRLLQRVMGCAVLYITVHGQETGISLTITSRGTEDQGT